MSRSLGSLWECRVVIFFLSLDNQRLTEKTISLAFIHVVLISCLNKIKFLTPHQFTCPGCNSSYIGKTEKNLATQLSEHSDPLKSSCEHANFILI